MEIENVSFIGCGALGIMYASHLLKTLEPNQLRFIADQGRIERYRDTEFFANGVRQAFQFVAPDADVPPSGLVIFTVKSYDLEDAIHLAKRHIGEGTIILSFLNGIQSEATIGETYGSAMVIPSMVAGMDATKTGHSVDYAHLGYVAFGAQPGNDPQDLERLCRFLDRVRFPYEQQEDIRKTLWWKFMLNIGVNQASALLGAPYGVFQRSPYARNLMLMGMQEACEVSQRLGIGLEEADIDKAMRTIDTLSPEGKTSMLQDIEAHRPTEVDIFAGTLMKLAEEQGVSVPVNTFLYNAIKALETLS